jgi:hypothetical protein
MELGMGIENGIGTGTGYGNGMSTLFADSA